MKLIIGFIILFSAMLGGFILDEGHPLALWQPTELLVILGCAAGAFVIANPVKVIKGAISGTINAVKPNAFNKVAHLELLMCLYGVAAKVRKSGLMSLEEDLDAPQKSELFKKYPKLTKSKPMMSFFADNMRLLILGAMKPHDLDMMLESELEHYAQELEKPSEAINRMADGMPGFGIVAAVMGIVVTMQFIGGDPKMLGSHVAAALVGTFCGILFSYGVFGPISVAISYQNKIEVGYMHCLKIFLVNLAAGIAPQITIEVVRKSISTDLRPTFEELENKIKGKK